MSTPLRAWTLQRVGPAAGCYEQSIIGKALASISCDDAFIGIDVCYERFCDELNVSLLMPCKVAYHHLLLDNDTLQKAGE